MEPDDGLEDDGPYFAWLPPDDRLWRHPSEVGAGSTSPADRDTGTGDTDEDDPVPIGTGSSGTGTATATAVDTRRPRAGATRIWTVAVVAGIIGALGASGIGMVSGAFDHQTTVVNSPMAPSDPSVSLAADAGPFTWSTIDDTVSTSVVAVDVQSPSGPVVGSGLVFLKGADGTTYLVTDSSLVSSGGRIRVTLASGDRHQGQLIGRDPLTGLAVIAINGTTPAVPAFGTVADLQVASEVLAIGARPTPGGSASVGVVSAEDRAVELAEGWAMDNLIAISSAAVQPAAAGGPVVDENGQIVGILVNLDPVNPADQSMSFAVPIDLVRHVVAQIISNARITHPWLGVTDAVDLSSADARSLGVDGGAQVISVSPDSPASRIGLQPGDVIISFDKQPVVSTGGLLTELLAQTDHGQPTPITFLHQGKPVRQLVTVAAEPGDNS